MSSIGMLKAVLGTILVVLAAQTITVAPAWSQDGEYTDIYVLGRRATTFSPHQPKNLEELKDLVDRFENDLRVVLEKGGWDGNPDDLFVAVRSAEEGDGTVTRRQVQPGESLKWMAYRKGGEPEVRLCLAAARRKPNYVGSFCVIESLRPGAVIDAGNNSIQFV